MSTLYLHIGTPKTGTTSLQRFFLKNRMALRKQGCKFPVFTKIDTENEVAARHNGRFLTPIIKDKNYISQCYDAIYELAKKHSKIIITDEYLFNNCGNSKKFWIDLKNKLYYLIGKHNHHLCILFLGLGRIYKHSSYYSLTLSNFVPKLFNSSKKHSRLNKQSLL